MRLLVVPVVVLGAMLVSCGPIDGSADDAAATTTAPDVRDCGAEQTEHRINFDREARRCFFEAVLTHEPAQFVSNSVSIEGAPIGRTYRYLGDGPVDVFHDARRDPLGSGKIELILCAALVSVEDWNAVTGDNRPLDEVFAEDECEYLGTQ
jgi:hypothetical protein